MKNRTKFPFQNTLPAIVATAFLLLQSPAFGQRLKVVSTAPPQSDSFSGYYVLAFIFGLVISGIVFFWMRNRLDDGNTANSRDRRYGAKRRKKVRARAVPEIDTGDAILSEFENVIKKNKELFRQLPILSIRSMPEAKTFEPLPDVCDDVLVQAVQHSNVDFESDEGAREAALQELSSYRTSTAVEAVAQVALYDLSSSLRSQALSVLAEYDHPVVFESILLACSDPARPVQTAAARALLNLSFDRTEAWVRILRTDDEILLRQSARAVIAAGFLDRTYDRLLHNEPQSAEEAFAIVALLIRAGETNEIFQEIAQPRDPRVARALLHIIEVVREPRVVEELIALSETFRIDESLRKIIERITGVAPQRDPDPDDTIAECEDAEVEKVSCVA